MEEAKAESYNAVEGRDISQNGADRTFPTVDGGAADDETNRRLAKLEEQVRNREQETSAKERFLQNKIRILHLEIQQQQHRHQVQEDGPLPGDSSFIPSPAKAPVAQSNAPSDPGSVQALESALKQITAERDILKQQHSELKSAATDTSSSSQVQSLTIVNKQLERDRDQYQSEARILASEVHELRRAATIPLSPSIVQYQGLAEQVRGIEQRAEAREAELRRVIEEARQNSKIQMARLNVLHQQEIDEKDLQIRKFRSELDTLLGAVQTLYSTKPVAVP